MRTTAFTAGVFSCALLLVSAMNAGHAKAESLDYLIADASPRISKELTILGIDQESQEQTNAGSSDKDNALNKVKLGEDKQEKEPVKHVVAKNESLTKIAKQYDTSWQRLFDKNESVLNPDSLGVGIELIVPSPEEVLVERALPQPVVIAASTQQPASQSSQSTTTAIQASPAVSGNTYYQGYCTWYVKNRRADMPNNLGNADTWVYRAAGQGYATGTAPRVGAVGQQGMHVVYVEAVHADGTVTVSEMNYAGWNIVSTRTVAASNFQYIY